MPDFKDNKIQAENLLKSIKSKDFYSIAQKVVQDIPVSEKDASFMLNTNEIFELGKIADFIRRRLHSDNTFYGVNMNLNYTNICKLRCPLCAFSCDKEDEKAYVLSIEDIKKAVKKSVAEGIQEVHIVGGLNPDLKLDYFENMLKAIKNIKKDLFIVGFTAVEYDYFAKINNISIKEVFKRFINAGLGALPGGGAEIFAPEVRKKIAVDKISGEKWLNIMEIAHIFGLKTNATMLYNHIETDNDIIDHLQKIRRLQDETHGFKTFVPLPYHDENTKIKAKKKSPTGFDHIRIYATSRIFLHNVPHIKALWMYLGYKMAQVLLNFGVDDIGSTYNNEKVVHCAGAKTPNFGSEEFIKNLILKAGFNPNKTTANYN